MNKRDRLRQFWLRTLLALGILWGTPLLVTAPFIFRGTEDSTWSVAAVLLNSLTILPGSILAFWHRRTASIWLTANALLVIFVMPLLLRQTNHSTISIVSAAVVPVFLAIALTYTEIKAWPNAINNFSTTDL